MGKWSDRLELLNAPVALPALPAKAASVGSAGVLTGASWIPGSPEAPPGEAVEQMSLSQFAMSGECHRVYSKVLDEIIILAADNAEIPDAGDTVVYRAAEARLLVGLLPAEVRAFHQVKVYFDGIIERATPSESQVDAADLLEEDTMS